MKRQSLNWSITPKETGFTVLIIMVSAAIAKEIALLYDDVAGALIFVLGITVAGAMGGLASAILAAVGAFLIYNFYVSEPALSFALTTGRDLAPLFIFNLCAVVTGVLAGRLKDHAQAARSSNVQLTALLELSRSLQSAARTSDVVATLEKVADPLIGARISLFRLQQENLVPLGPSADNEETTDIAWRALDAIDAPVRWGGLLGLRLDGGAGPSGALVLKGSQAARLDPGFLTAIANMVALAQERAELGERMADQRAAARAEELKTALLSSVSHDFRTPLTTISASASSLITFKDRLDPETSMRLLRSIVDECERLNRYTTNLLEMSRIEAGSGPAWREVLSVSEMIGVAVQRVRDRAGRRTIANVSDEPDLLVLANPALFELVLVNVFDNAIRYSDDATRIAVSCRQAGHWCVISIADEGLGIPEADLTRVFERFYRVERAEASPKGSGLGLAIAKGFVEALDGRIEAAVPGMGDTGTEITIRLPIATDAT